LSGRTIQLCFCTVAPTLWPAHKAAPHPHLEDKALLAGGPTLPIGAKQPIFRRCPSPIRVAGRSSMFRAMNNEYVLELRVTVADEVTVRSAALGLLSESFGNAEPDAAVIWSEGLKRSLVAMFGKAIGDCQMEGKFPGVSAIKVSVYDPDS
jgi:hypothetical protein